jgi:hypothetical protein
MIMIGGRCHLIICSILFAYQLAQSSFNALSYFANARFARMIFISKSFGPELNQSTKSFRASPSSHKRHHVACSPVAYKCVQFAYHDTLPESALPRILVAMFAWTDAKIDSKPITTIPAFGGKAATRREESLNFRMFDCSSYCSSDVKP